METVKEIVGEYTAKPNHRHLTKSERKRAAKNVMKAKRNGTWEETFPGDNEQRSRSEAHSGS